ncbi:unnamed protein product, partial [marine sediment metagenome]
KQREFDVPPDHYVFELPDIVGELLRADLPPEIKAIIDPEPFTVDRIYQDMRISRDPYNRSFRISLKDEMISVEDLDKGRYKGLIVFSPEEEKKLQGFIYIPATISAAYLEPPPFVRHTTAGLANALKKFTSITVNADINLRLDSRRLSKFPFVYIAADSQFELTESEKKNLGEYLRNGGFAFLEAYGEVDQSMPPRGAMPMRQLLKDVLGSKGQLIPIPNDYPLYHCFFDFDGGPPTTANPRFDRPGIQPAHYLEG